MKKISAFALAFCLLIACSSDTETFIITAKEFVKPMPETKNLDITVEIKHKKSDIYNVTASFNLNDKSSRKVSPLEAFYFSSYVVKYFGLSKGFSGFGIDNDGTTYGKNEVKYSLTFNKTGDNLKQKDDFNKHIRPEFILSGK